MLGGRDVFQAGFGAARLLPEGLVLLLALIVDVILLRSRFRGRLDGEIVVLGRTLPLRHRLGRWRGVVTVVKMPWGSVNIGQFSDKPYLKYMRFAKLGRL